MIFALNFLKTVLNCKKKCLYFNIFKAKEKKNTNTYYFFCINSNNKMIHDFKQENKKFTMISKN